MRTESTGTELLARLLASTELRARVISSNLANQNTPGYVRREVHFEEHLAEAMKSGRRNLARIQPQVDLDRLSPARPDGNNVTLELELNAMRENRLLYETYASMLKSHMSMLEAAITEGR